MCIRDSWNPYNCDLRFGRSIIMMQGNGRQEMWTRNVNSSGNQFDTQWLNFEGGRSASFGGVANILNSEGYNDPYMGSYYFSIPETTFGPGECLVFSPARAGEYDGFSAYRPGPYNLNNNELSCTVSPDPGRSYYVSASEYDDPEDEKDIGGIPFRPFQFWYKATPYIFGAGKAGIEFQSDDSRAILKQVRDTNTITFEVFDKLPQAAVLSGSLQFGAGREPRVQRSEYEKMPVELLDRFNPKPTVIPNVRTRESIRLRWFDEHPSNTLSGKLAGTSYFDDALLANWNPRASYAIRSPWENIGGIAPWFFGAYTRDLFDGAVSWNDQVPVPRNGRYHGNPFGPPQEGNASYVLFDVPREETGLISLGQLQHAKLSELIWHPSYAIGNSLADPRLGTGGFKGLNRTSAVSKNSAAAKDGGFGSSEIGWSNDKQRGADKDDWAATARAILGDIPKTDNLVYDLSFEGNQKLWDRFFLSTIPYSDSTFKLAAGTSLANPRNQSSPIRSGLDTEAVTAFDQAAAHIMVDGAFNVNSTSVPAWKQFLLSNMNRKVEVRNTSAGDDSSPENEAVFPRVLHPYIAGQPRADRKTGTPQGDKSVFTANRSITDEEAHLLAKQIVREVRLRGPFTSLSDFVNRRLVADSDTRYGEWAGLSGTLQTALDRATIEDQAINDYLMKDGDLAFDDSQVPAYLFREHVTGRPAGQKQSRLAGTPGELTQGDLLRSLGPLLTVRGDTFTVRAYGESVDKAGNITAKAWCEATVQRTAELIQPDDDLVAPDTTRYPFGRSLTITRFRWLNKNEI